MSFSYEDAPYPIEWLTPELIERAIEDNSETSRKIFQSLSEITDIPLNGNKNANLWRGKNTAITYALGDSNHQYIYAIYKRIARLVGLLYRNCGIPVQGDGSGLNNPLNICVSYDNVPAASVLLRDTDACLSSQNWETTLNRMITNGQTEMLRLFSMYKSRTFPDADATAYLNQSNNRIARDIPLFKAVLRNDPVLVHILISDFAANPYIQDQDGKSALDLIRDNTNARRDYASTRNREEIIRLLQPNERILAFLMSQHERLGRESEVHSLSPEIIRYIHELGHFRDTRPS